MKKAKFQTLTTPPGVAIFPKLNTPDTKFNPKGTYSVRLLLSGVEAKPLIERYEAELDRYFEEVKAELMNGDGRDKVKAKALKKVTDKPYKPEYDDEGNETGNWVFHFKLPAKVEREGKPDMELKPDFFDARGRRLVKVPEIWGGSVLRVSAQMRPFNTAIGVGVSLRLQAVQIIELRQGGERDAGDYGFEATDGFTADEDDEAEAFSSGAEGQGAQEDNEDF